jgi:hypothetical protein
MFFPIFARNSTKSFCLTIDHFSWPCSYSWHPIISILFQSGNDKRNAFCGGIRFPVDAERFSPRRCLPALIISNINLRVQMMRHCACIGKQFRIFRIDLLHTRNLIQEPLRRNRVCVTYGDNPYSSLGTRSTWMTLDK